VDIVASSSVVRVGARRTSACAWYRPPVTLALDLLLRGGLAVTPMGTTRADIGVRAGKIAALGDLARTPAARVIDCTHLHVLPGVIDSQVHFREPGLTHKEDLETGTRSAALGGVTAIFEMPNTKPATTTRAALEEKLAAARGRAHVDFAFFIGAAAENADELGVLERIPGCAGVKVFLGSSTGSLLVEDPAVVRAVLRSGRRRVAIHAEDEQRLRERRPLATHVSQHPVWRDAETARRATEAVLRVAREVGRPLHILHVTTADELPLLEASRDVATVEVTPQHLSLHAPDCYETLGSYAQMNPPVRERAHQEALWRAIASGLVDVIGSDHAPHTREEKARPYPESPSGMTGVQTLVPIMLDHVNAGRLTLERFVDLTSAGPARVYDVAAKGRIALGYDADFTLVDLAAEHVLSDDEMASRSGWTPFHGRRVRGMPVGTIVRGTEVMRDGVIVSEGTGEAVRFFGALPRRDP
jgi:dihydroorotase